MQGLKFGLRLEQLGNLTISGVCECVGMLIIEV